jgi:hypothetical protein
MTTGYKRSSADFQSERSWGGMPPGIVTARIPLLW